MKKIKSGNQKKTSEGGATPPAATAAATTIIKFNFQGLFAFCFRRDNSECQVGVLSTAPGHQLYILIHETSSNGEETQYPITLGPALARLKDRIYLEIDGVTPGIIKVIGGGQFDRKKPPDEANKNDLKWLIDYEGPELHDRPIDLRKGVLKPVFHFSSGHFHTRSISSKQHFLVEGSKTKFRQASVNSLVSVRSRKTADGTKEKDASPIQMSKDELSKDRFY